ncbi:CBASS cGAMP-activated phospholipase [Caproiciproducens sp. LBM24188]|nr:patatin [Oscillospiraceae bacterium]HHV32904.1 patatin [Clostridiales bacterium]
MIAVLSIDGGGIRGVVPAAILSELEQQVGKPISKIFSIIAGTSTGGIIASVLSVPNQNGNPKFTAEDVRLAYEQFGGNVLKRKQLHTLRTLGGLTGPRYPDGPLEHFLKQYLGNVHLHSSVTKLLIPAYDMVTCTPWFFKTTYASLHRSNLDDPPLWQVARATAAAPAYFRPFEIGSHCFIDGGVFASNPALCAYAEACNAYPNEKDFLVVSLGTGEHQKSHSFHEIHHWGVVNWLIPLWGVLMNSSSATVNYQMKALIRKDNYYRIQVPLDEASSNMDDSSPENIRHLQSLARAQIRQHAGQFQQLCQILRQIPEEKGNEPISKKLDKPAQK